MSTFLIEELNILIGWDFISLKSMIQFSVKVAIISIPRDLAMLQGKDENENMQYNVSNSLMIQVSKSEYLSNLVSALEEIPSNSIFSFMLDFDWYNYLHEMLVLSVKLSFAGDEINEKGECERILDEIWMMMCHSYTTYKVYSFLLFVKYKLQNKVCVLI
jgi:hypothetical protein